MCARPDPRVHAGALAVDAERAHRQHRARDRRPRARAHHLPLHVRRRRLFSEKYNKKYARPSARQLLELLTLSASCYEYSLLDVHSLHSTNHCVIGSR